MDFIHDLGRRIVSVTAELRSFNLLKQRLSVAVHRGNAVCVSGTMRSCDHLDDF